MILVQSHRQHVAKNILIRSDNLIFPMALPVVRSCGTRANTAGTTGTPARPACRMCMLTEPFLCDLPRRSGLSHIAPEPTAMGLRRHPRPDPIFGREHTGLAPRPVTFARDRRQGSARDRTATRRTSGTVIWCWSHSSVFSFSAALASALALFASATASRRK